MGTSGNNTLVKYILVCGLENSSGLEVDDTTSSTVISNRRYNQWQSLLYVDEFIIKDILNEGHYLITLAMT